jgi:hypothetical protein
LWLLAGLAALLVAAALAWFLKNFEQRSMQIDAGYSAAARRNPFLAAERFLARLDIPVQSSAGRELLRDLPPTGDTLVVNGLAVLNADRRDALHRWIEQGGRLLVEAASLWDEEDRPDTRRDDFLARYGVQLLEQPDPKDRSLPGAEAVAEIAVDDYPHPVEVGFGARYYLEDSSGEASGAVAAGGRIRLLQYEIGDGMLTVTADNRFLTNRNIGRQDHALFLALLTSPPGGGKVWLLYDSDIPWLGALLWQRAPFAMVSALCLVVLFLWHLGGRLGPLLPTRAEGHRDLLVHLQASAGFLWRHGQVDRLTEVTRGRIERKWLRRHPSLQELDKDGRSDRIARHVDIAPGEVRQVLYPPKPGSVELVSDTALLQRLWSSLSARRGTIPPSPTRVRRPLGE